MTDRKRLQQILINLIANAIKYTKQGFVRCRVVSLLNNSNQTTLCISVEDSGIGIEKSKLETIFNRFEQIESVYQRKHDGVGLGLAIVKELIEIMGGSITVSSEFGKGSKFSCVIPFDLQTTDLRFNADADTQSLLSEHEERNLNLRLLVVEDNKINQKIARLLLEQMGCHVEIAENAAAALQFSPADFDMIFMDLGLPDMDGFQAAQQIRTKQNGKHVPIIAMTAHVFAHDQERCYQVGMNEVVAKPIMREHLLTVIKRWAPIATN
jgi:CheY-like chemotaxis protein